MSARLLGLVPVMQDEEPLGEEERQETDAHEGGHPARIVDRVDRLWEHVEEGDGDDDAPGQCDRRCELASKLQSGQASAERGQDG
jgi:hypothetical protein